MNRLTCVDSVGNISTAPKKNKKSDRYGTQECLEKLYMYEEIGYTPEELKLCFNPPDKLYIIDYDDDLEKNIIKSIYPVDGEQIELSGGDVSFNCGDKNDDYYIQPLDGLGIDYFLTIEDAKKALAEMKLN